MKIILKYPTRQRPKLFMDIINKYRRMLSGKHDVKFIVTADSDDLSMNNNDMINFLGSINNLNYSFGNNKTKVEAINADLNGVQFDIVLLVSDDMVPQVNNYDDIIAVEMSKHFPNLDGALHFNDGRVGKVLNTLSIMGKKLYDEWGYIYHPDYTSLWCDNEFQAVTERDNKSAYIDKVIIKHEWVSATGSDALHKRNEVYYNKDKNVFEIRKSNGFPKHSCLHLLNPEPPIIKPIIKPTTKPIIKPTAKPIAKPLLVKPTTKYIDKSFINPRLLAIKPVVKPKWPKN